MAPGDVAARGGHGGGHAGGHGSHPGARIHSRVFVGAALFAPLYLYPPLPPYSGPPPSVTPFWYFCKSLDAYYPYVGDCPEGWQPVVPPSPS